MPFYDVAGGLQNPDILGAYIKGRMAPGAEELQQQQVKAYTLANQSAEANLQSSAAINAQIQQLIPQMVGGGAAPSGGQQAQDVSPSAVPGMDTRSPFDQMTDPRRLMVGAQIGSLFAIRKGEDPNKPYADVQKILADNRNDQIQRMKLQAAPYVAFANNVMTSGDPASLILNNGPQFRNYANNYLEKVGGKANDYSNPDLLRQAATAWLNDIHAATGDAPVAMPTQMQKVTGQGGYQYLIDPITQKPMDIPGQITPYQQQSIARQDRQFAFENQKFNFERTKQDNPKPSEKDKQVETLYGSVLDAERTIREITKSGNVDTSSRGNAILGAAPFRWSGLDTLQSDDFRKYESAGLRWAANLLYIKSGATAPPEEIRSTWKQFFPQPGEGKEVAEQKAAARANELDNISKVYKLENPLAQSANSPRVPAPGDVVKGYRFKGGDPSNRNNWEKAGG